MKNKFILSFLMALSPFALYNVAEAKKAIDIEILHINDHHSHIEQERMELLLNGEKTTVTIGGFPRVNQAVKELTKGKKNTLVLHAGDALTGTLYYTLFEGKADAEMMNLGQFDAFTLGNHEFDDGNDRLRTFLDQLNIPVVSYNVVPDENSVLKGKWEPYIIKKINGEQVAIVGLDVVGKTIESSSPGKDVKFIDEVEAAQNAVSELQEKGINKIILLSHAGYEKNLEIASKVSGVDVIITGDTHYLLGDNFKEYGLEVFGEYPTQVLTPAGEPALVVEAWNYSYLLGDLKVSFDKNGVITQYEAKPVILLGDDKFEKRDANNKKYVVSEEEKREIINYILTRPDLKIVSEEPITKEALIRYTAEKNALGQQPAGSSKDNMPGGSENRIPNESNPEGSVATTMVAEVVLHKLEQMGTGNIDFTLFNAGGTRTNIKAGDITYDDVYTMLPFTSNTIYTLEIKGSEVKELLEDVLEFVFNGGSSGAFAYGANIRYEAQKEGTHGTRVTKVEVFNKETKKWELINPDKVYVVGTNSYIASGKDGYKTFGVVTSKNPGVNTYLGVETAFIEYLKEKGAITRPESSNVKFKY